MATLRRTCAKVHEPSELRFLVVGGVGRGIAVLDGGPRRARDRGGFGEFCFPFVQWEKPYTRQRRNVCNSYAKLDNISVRQNVSLESSFRWLLGDVFISKITAGFYEKLAKK